MKLKKPLISQFMKPNGFLGYLAGFIMAHRPSNRERSFWTISLLDIKHDDRVLEIGFGPGVAIENICNIVTDGFVVGIDHSPVMVKQARTRNREAVKNGRVEILQASVTEPPGFGEPFDKIFAINAFQFWEEPLEILKTLRGMLKPGGFIALTLQPRMKNATDADAKNAGADIVEKLKDSGFVKVRLETKKMKPVLAVCAIGVK